MPKNEPWVVVNKKTRRVVATESVRPPNAAYGPKNKIVFYPEPVEFEEVDDEGNVITSPTELPPEVITEGMELYGYVNTALLLRACMLVVLEEINYLRVNPGKYDPITEEDLEKAIEKKLGEL